MNKGYLIEKTLGDFLKQLKIGEVISNKHFSKEHKFRPDFRIEEVKVIVEFDGYQHYSTPARAVLDTQREIFYTLQGYKLIRIPYWDFDNIETILEKELVK